MTLHTARGDFDLDDKHILANDPILPGEYNPSNVRLWLIGNEYGPIVALWASCEQDALDEMLDKGYEHFLVEPGDVEPDDEYAHLGNAGEPCNLDYAWIEPVTLEKERDFALLVKFAEARACGNDHI